MIQSLPLEIIQQISFELSPGDAVNLAYTNHFLYHAVLPRLYCGITVDASKKHYTHEALLHICNYTSVPEIYHNKKQSLRFQPTRVQSLYAFHRICKNLIMYPQYCQYVQIVNVENELPDISDLELNSMFMQIFPHLANLKRLNWLAITNYLSMELVALLPHPEKLLQLTGNFKHFEAFPNASRLCNLGHLNVSGFQDSNNLGHFDLLKFPSLEKLIIAKNSSWNNEMISTRSFNNEQVERLMAASDVINSSPTQLSQPQQKQQDGPGYVEKLFPSRFIPHQKLSLSNLSLKDITLTASDAKTLINNVEVSVLQKLSIYNCTEILFEQVDSASWTQPHRRTPPSQVFLDTLIPHLTSLSSLELDITNELYNHDAVYRGVLNLPRSLDALVINLRYHQFENVNASLDRFFSALVAKHASSLTYLNFQFDIVNGSLITPRSAVIAPTPWEGKPASYDYSIDAISALSKCHKLRYLKIPINQFQIPQIFNVIRNVSQLVLLQLVLVNSGSETPSPGLMAANSLISSDYFNFPSPVINGYVTDKMEQYRNFAADFRSLLPGMKFVSFEKNGESFVFDCGAGISLKEGMFENFDHLVRAHM